MSIRGMLQAASLVLVSVWLSACDEDAARSGNGNGPSLAVSSANLADKPALSVSVESLHFQSHEEGAQPAAQLFTGQISAGSVKPPYIDVEWSSNGLASVLYDRSGDSITVSATAKDPDAVGVGVFTDQIIVNACEDSRCRRHLEGSPKTVTVTYTVRNHLKVISGPLAYAHVLGSYPLPGSKALSLQGTSVHWEASADSSWIQLSASSGVTPSSVAIGIDPAGLAIGGHAGIVTFTNTDTGESKQVPVTLQVAEPVLSVAPGALSFMGMEGSYMPAQPLILTLDTGTSAYEWTATVNTAGGPQWLFLSSSAGIASSNPTALAVSVNTTGLAGGNYSGQLTFTTSVAGVALKQTVPVSLELASPQWVPDNGVALVSTPTLSKLTHTVKVKDRWTQSTTAWMASSNQPWLSVTPSGTSGGNLTVTAQPAGLETNTVHYADVTLHFGGGSAQGTETVRVGLWVGASAPNSQDSLPVTYQVIETDPIRPYVYAHNGNTLFVYNLYTASLVTSLTGLGSALGSMTVSTDGSTLYVLDTASSRRIIPVNLDTLTPRPAWALNDTTTSSITFARPNGQGMILTNGGKLYSAATGASISSVSGSLSTGLKALSSSLDGSLVCGVSTSYYASYPLYCYALQYKDIGGGSVTLTARMPGSNGYGYTSSDVAINHDGTRVYLASSSYSGFAVFDGQTMSVITTLPADYYGTNAVEVGSDSRLYGSSNSPYGSLDLWVYDHAGVSQGSYRMAGYSRNVLEQQLKVSGDGKRFVVLTSDPRMKIVTAP